MKASRRILISTVALLWFCQAGPLQGQLLPYPTVLSQLSDQPLDPMGFYPGEWAIVGVQVHGATVTGTGVTARVDMVFLLDESGSMSDSDRYKIRRTTIQQILAGLNPAQHRVAIVVFSDHATVLGGGSSLTTDFSGLSQLLGDLSDPDGLTNLADAMQLANTLLTGSTANSRIGILLTDGYPQSENMQGYDTVQDAIICGSLVPVAIDQDINYHVVHLAPGAYNPQGLALLQTCIAGRTEGEYLTVEQADQLANVLPQIVTEASQTLIPKDVCLDVQFAFGSNQYSRIAADNIVLSGIPSCEVHQTDFVEGRVLTEKRRQLPRNQAISVAIPVTSFIPIAPSAPPSVTTVTLECLKSEAVLQYHLGDGQIRTKRIPAVSATWVRIGDTPVRKHVDADNRTITISVSNFLSQGPLRNVTLLEYLAPSFEVQYDTWVPEPKIVGSAIHNTKVPIDWFYWELGDIERFATRSVTFSFRYLGPQAGIVAVDMTKPPSQVEYTHPVGGVRKIVKNDALPPNGWYGDTTIDAATLNTTSDVSVGPDLYINSTCDVPASVSTPASLSLWNDAGSDGYGEQAEYAYFAHPQPLDLTGSNKLWIRIDNGGTLATQGQISISVCIKAQYEARPEDLDNSTWTHLGNMVFASSLIPPSSHIVNGFEWNPSTALTTGYRDALRSAGYAYFKVVAIYGGSELRINNNAAVVRVPISP